MSNAHQHNRVPEEYFAIGTNIRAIPKEETDGQMTAGTIIYIKELTNHMEYFVRFHPPKDQRLSDWYVYKEMEFVSAVSSTFKQPKINEVRNIEYVEIGNYRLRSWYFSPYPAPFNHLETLYVCPRCLKYAQNQQLYKKHYNKCQFVVPGIKIYDDGIVSFYEVDGRAEKLFCQFLCLFSKLFLDGKTLFYNTEIFLFYVMTVRQSCLDTDLQQIYQNQKLLPKDVHQPSKRLQTPNTPTKQQNDSKEEILVGYFSKEKLQVNVLSCILTFPAYLRMGIGNLLMDFAYMLARMENRVGGPEEPLSDLGVQSFTSYWKKKLLKYLIDKATEKYGEYQYVENEELQQATTTHNEDSRDEQSTPTSKVTYGRKGDKNDLEIPIADVSYETAILEKHIKSSCEQLKTKVKKECIIVSHIFYKQLCQQQYQLEKQRQQKGNLVKHDLSCEYLVWEPYPAMFVQNQDVFPKDDIKLD